MYKLSNDRITIFDGAMGTQLQKSGLKLGENPETLSILNKEQIISIHKSYIDAGAQIIYANTFGANSIKLENCEYSVEQVVTASIQNAKTAAQGTDVKIALDIGPLGEMMQPTGSLSFEDAYTAFKQIMVCGEQSGADLIVLETMTDLYEVKAGVLAAKENTKLPVFVSMTFEENQRTFTGCCIQSMVATLEGLSVDAIGINCSLGPKEILPIAKTLAQTTVLPIFVKPNAGLPNLETNTFDITADEFVETIKEYVEVGIQGIGGCCGTQPEYIQKLSIAFKDVKPVARNVEKKSCVCTPTNYVEIKNVKVIGERLNPTGKKIFRQALIDNNLSYILNQAVEQIQAGADILDVNVGVPGIDEQQMMVTVCKALQSVTDLPLQIDSSDKNAIQAALRIYNGKAIVNSVNGEQKVLDEVLPLVKKYGACVVGLTLDENGIPNKAEDRFKIAQRILTACEKYGIPKQDVFIDCLTLTASAQQKEVYETLKAVRMVKTKLGLKTVLGVSNISFGLPNRELLNHTFLTLAMGEGLDLPIINPNIHAMMDAVRAFRVLYNMDEKSSDYIEEYKNFVQDKACARVKNSSEDTQVQNIETAILKGLKQQTIEYANKLLLEIKPLDLVNNHLIPALDKVGNLFEKGELFLPQLLQSADAAGKAFEIVKQKLEATGEQTNNKGTIVVATVKGDVHDIGKNIVKVILENYGYKVIDLGKDVAVEKVVEAVKQYKAPLLGLSALMTTTLKSMQETITAVKQAGLECKIMVGGAVLTPEYAIKIGADYYAKDAKQGVDIAKQVLG